MKKIRLLITAGFAMFAMFFGSGNLVFPLSIGTKSLDQFPFAICGLILTAVIVPFLGLIGIILYDGKLKSFFSSIGRGPAFLLTFVMLALLGPFGVVPRCILVSYGSLQYFIPQVSALPLFSLAFCFITLLVIWNHNKIVSILGKVLTPWLILGIFTIIVAGLWFSQPTAVGDIESTEAFKLGLFQGYQTMDLLAAFFFSATIFEFLRGKIKSDNNQKSVLIKTSIIASIIGAGLLAFVYFGFVSLGAKYQPLLINTPPEKMLSAIANHTLGSLGAPIIGTTAVLACLTTASILAMLFAEFVSERIFRNKFNRQWAIIITLIISFGVSLVEFPALTKYLGLVLSVAYPALIVLALSSIIGKLVARDFSRWAFWIATIASAAYFFVI